MKEQDAMQVEPAAGVAGKISAGSADGKGRQPKRPGVFTRCMAFAGPRKPLIVLSMLLAALSSAASFVPYVAIYATISAIVAVYPDLSALDARQLSGYGMLALAGVVADVGCYLCALLCSHAAAFDTQYRIKIGIVDHLGKVPLGHVVRLGMGRISKIMDEAVDGIEQFIGHSIPDLAATAVAPVVLIVLLFVFDWRFGVATIVAVAVACIVQFSCYADKRLMSQMGRYQQVKEEMGNAAVEYVRGMRVVKAFGQTARSFRKLAEAVKDYTGLALDVTFFFQNSMPGFTALLNSAYLFVLPVGILLAPGADDWPAFVLSLVFYLLFVHSISSVFQKILYVSEDSMIAGASIGRIDSVLKLDGLSSAGEAQTPRDASVEFENVSFAYEEGGPQALENVSFTVPAGSVCAVVGPSGSGKSTLANLLARFWDVDRGCIRIGGADVRSMGSDELMEQLSLVFQDFHLFRESIADNIRRGRDGATDADVIAAAKAAQAHDFIERLPSGYDTVVGAAGIHLSGGEGQRIALARAILSDAPVVVLDEATAFADPENERLIQKAFEGLMDGKTVLMIAHRLSTVVGADKIVVMDDGKVAEEGTHAELLASGGTYARMWERYEQSLVWGISSDGGARIAAAPPTAALPPEAVAAKSATAATTTASVATASADGNEDAPGKRQPWLKRLLSLSDEGYRGLARSSVACTLTDLSLTIPFMCTVAAFSILVGTLAGEPFEAGRLWAVFACGIAGLVVTFIAAKNDYRKTYVAAYTESESMRLSLAEHLRRLPMSFFNRRGTADVADRIMSDVTAQETMLSSTVPQLVAGCVSTVAICVLLAFFNWMLAFCVLVTLPIAALIVLASHRREKRLFERQQDARIESLACIQDYLEGLKDIRACHMVGEKSHEMNEALLSLKRMTMKVELAVDLSVSLANAILRSGVGITVFVGTALLAGGSVDFMTLLMFLLIASRVYGPILMLVSKLPSVLSLSTKTARLRAIMDEPEACGDVEVLVDSHQIAFEDVRFAYEEKEVLHGVSFVAREGQVTALVGPSGSGKSTCAQLAARFWIPGGGRVTCGGRDIAGFREESWLSHVSMVFQDVLLFDDTVAGNIRIGREDATDDEVRAAAETACCTEFIDRLPDGFDTMLGENGAALSGGERQRLSIARALLKDAPVILLDEATASLDPESETLVQQAVGRLCAGKTVIVIAHRMRTVAGADHIVVIDDGCVVEEGSHGLLLERQGLYARLWELQHESAGWNVERR